MSSVVRLLFVLTFGILVTACPESGKIGENPDPPEPPEEEPQDVEMAWRDSANEVCAASSERAADLAAAATTIPDQVDPAMAFNDQLEMSSELFEAENEALEAIDNPSEGLAFVTEYLEQRRAVAQEIIAALDTLDWSARVPTLIEVDEGLAGVNQASVDLGLVSCAPSQEQIDEPVGPYAAFQETMAQSFELSGFGTEDTPCLLDALETGLIEGTIADPFAPTSADAATLIEVCGVAVE